MSESQEIEALIARRLRCLDAMRKNIGDAEAFDAARRLDDALAARIVVLRSRHLARPLTVHPYFQTEE